MLMFGSLRASGHRKCSCLLVARRSSSTSSSTHNPPSVSLDFHRDASLAILTLCNAQRRNALTYSMMHQLDAHVNTLHEWSRDISQNSARVLILTGSGGSFCAGLDIKQDDDKDVLQDGREMTQHMSRVTNCIQALPVLSVAAIDGNAIGGGAELSTCTDLVVLSRQSTIKFVHASRGASPGWGGGRRLQKRVGRRKALRMLLLGESVFGEEEAEQLDYADYVAEEGESSLDAAMRLVVDPILNLPCSQSVRAIKRVVSVADGDEDVIDTASGRLRYVATDATDDDSMTKEYNNTAVKSEIDAFLQVWGGESNRELIEQTRESLKDKKT
uniref:Ethylmalonyl-CoA decarboxylase n=1 Tax=Skeletonema marinoi TaxID=267567 RepID=A0A7S2KS71_9STRA|mmetsp:Transcript_16037/g.27083  ORF Transcript_16037/g.27083 Transcript_16037/m.27083 type:complete len:329 (+) Transcript_16037:82-1068(+)